TIILASTGKITSKIWSTIIQKNNASKTSISIGFQVYLLPSDFQGEVVSGEVSFMSEQAIFYLGSIGLLGEYCPSSRKKNRPLLKGNSCMHRLPYQEYPEFHGCYWLQPFIAYENQSSPVLKNLEEDIAATSISVS
ncbi:hypothetical protein Prudu_009328, partial [Prunus dulcis]